MLFVYFFNFFTTNHFKDLVLFYFQLWEYYKNQNHGKQSNQIKSNQIKSNQIKSNQIKLKKCKSENSFTHLPLIQAFLSSFLVLLYFNKIHFKKIWSEKINKIYDGENISKKFTIKKWS